MSEDTDASKAPAATTVAAAPSETSPASSSAAGDLRRAGAALALGARQTEERVDAAIQRWVSAHLSNSPVSRATAAWNHLQTVAIPRLREFIMKELD